MKPTRNKRDEPDGLLCPDLRGARYIGIGALTTTTGIGCAAGFLTKTFSGNWPMFAIGIVPWGPHPAI